MLWNRAAEDAVLDPTAGLCWSPCSARPVPHSCGPALHFAGFCRTFLEQSAAARVSAECDTARICACSQGPHCSPVLDG